MNSAEAVQALQGMLEVVLRRLGPLQALAECSKLRPSVDISVGGEGSSEGVGVGGARTEYRSAVAA